MSLVCCGWETLGRILSTRDDTYKKCFIHYSVQVGLILFFSFYSAAENKKPQLEDGVEKKDVGKEERCKEPEPKIDNHEPRLGPRPRSHNKVLNPPGGKSSIAFY